MTSLLLPPGTNMSPIDWRDIVERRIQEAEKRGQFDDLPGRGRPLDLRENPFAKPEWRLAHRMLKHAGFALDWIELHKTIRLELAQCQKLLEDQLLWADKVLASTDDREEIDAQLDDIYRWTVASYTERAKKLNQKMELFNLMVPLMHLQKHKVPIVEELRKFRKSWLERTQGPR
jgi:DnaJ family protein C protein 28